LLARLDIAVLRFLRTRGHSPRAERAMKRLGLAAEWGALWSAGALAAAAVDERRRGAWIRVAALAPASVWVNYAVKLAVRRRRPVLDGIPPLSKVRSKLSFPSAHAASSFAAATAIRRIEPRAAVPTLTLAALISAGRPYLGVHYPSDVLAGAALGMAVGRLAPLEDPR
jgi:undecaprenyl-diphosphatase